jgi:hypothetical protein
MEMSPGYATLLGCSRCCPAEGTSGNTFLTALASIAALIRKIALCCFEIRDDGIEVGEWLHDMADLDLQCVVPMVKEHNFGHHVLGRLWRLK